METARKRPRRDRLSDLPDCILGHILSFLPTQEAGRAAILARSWRRAFADVHTISFDDYRPNMRYLDRVNAALLARRRCGGGDGDGPLRSIRVAMRYLPSPLDSYDVDLCISYALRRGLQELFLAMPSWSWAAEDDALGRTCRRVHDDSSTHSDSDSDTDSSSSDDDDDDYDPCHSVGVGPAKLYSCATLRALHLVYCSLRSLQSTTIDLPSLETLSLTRIRHYWRSGDDIQRLIAGCPRLSDLRLEACSRITDLTVPHNMRLRSLALRCCHHLRRVTVDLSETRTFEYRDVPCHPTRRASRSSGRRRQHLSQPRSSSAATRAPRPRGRSTSRS
ncbi:hypothetical protein ACQ4PT_044029 [Festuca glaucescens]